MVAKANGKRSDWERLEELEEAVYHASNDRAVTISMSNFNWLMEKASKWVYRDEQKVRHESYNWTEAEMQAMKRNGLIPNNCATRIKFLGWTREAAVYTPKLTEEQRIERVREGVQRHQTEKRSGE